MSEQARCAAAIPIVSAPLYGALRRVRIFASVMLVAVGAGGLFDWGSQAARLLASEPQAAAVDETDAAETPLSPAQTEFFESKIRPLLVHHCYQCHGGDKSEGNLALDSRAGWRLGGDTGPAIVPGKPDDSPLMWAVRYDPNFLQMPPKAPLPAESVKLLERWIADGAPDPRTGGQVKAKREIDLVEGRNFWSYRPLLDEGAPQVQDASWPRGDVDRFILAALEARNLRPAPTADKTTLVRRLYFDLHGLPPTPAEIDAFVDDAAPDAYERLVDRLLASPRFGERWGRHWLDVVRYAESFTLRGFIVPSAWRYRDYVIESFNNDRPVDAFIREQIAGDLLPYESLEEQRRNAVAVAFLAMGNTNLEDQDKGQLRMDVVDEQLDVLGKAFLGQTLGCARCHDHKFDPIPTRDYYAMAGILRNTKVLEHANVSMWLEAPLPLPPDEEAVYAEHDAAVARAQQQVKSLKDALAKVAAGGSSSGPNVLDPQRLPGVVVDSAQAKAVGQWTLSKFSGRYIGDGYLHDDNNGKGQKSLTFLPELTHAGLYEVRLAYVPGTNRATNAPVTVFSADGETTIHVDQRQPPPIEGRFISLGRHRFELNGQGFVVVTNQNTQGHVIADAVQFLPLDGEARPAAAKHDARPDAPNAEDPRAAETARLTRELKDAEQALKTLTTQGPKRPMTLTVREEKEMGDTRVHIRGSVHTLGELAPRGFLQVASTEPSPSFSAAESGRRELADWLVSPDNPLTARVFVNRAWHWLFGAGLVRTTDNFGTTGETPSHPELLDHLALRFMNDGWSLKSLVRRLVLSETYRQSTAPSPQAVAVDPENRLLWRMNRRRLDAECIRDAMLQTSGQLQHVAGGPTIRPGVSSDYGYQHQETFRSVYVPVLRNSLPEVFEAFDFADPSMVVGRRNVSTAPPQALFLMNHPFVLEQAEKAAEQTLAALSSAEKGEDVAAQLRHAFRLTLGREPQPAEIELSVRFLDQAAADSETKEADAQVARRQAWARLYQALYASVDFRYVE